MYSNLDSIHCDCARGKFFLFDSDPKGRIFHLLGYAAMRNEPDEEWTIWDRRSREVTRNPRLRKDFRDSVLTATPLEIPWISAATALDMLVSGLLTPDSFSDSRFVEEHGPTHPSEGDPASIYLLEPKNTDGYRISQSGLIITEPYDPDVSPLQGIALNYHQLSFLD